VNQASEGLRADEGKYKVVEETTQSPNRHKVESLIKKGIYRISRERAQECKTRGRTVRAFLEADFRLALVRTYPEPSRLVSSHQAVQPQELQVISQPKTEHALKTDPALKLQLCVLNPLHMLECPNRTSKNFWGRSDE